MKINHWFEVINKRSGRTYYANLDVDLQLSPEVLLNDLNELVDYLTNRFEKDQVNLMGHSWGTVLGSLYIAEYPEKVSTYISIGQNVNFLAGESLAVEEAKRLAAKDGNEEYIEELSAIHNKFVAAKDYEDFNINDLMNLRTLTFQYLPSDNLVSTLPMIWVGASSPDMSIIDLKWYMKTMFQRDEFVEIQKPLIDYLFYGFNSYENELKYEVPVYFISGDDDWITPYPLVLEYYETIKAPDKEMILLENTGHSPFQDDPEAFSSAVKSLLKR